MATALLVGSPAVGAPLRAEPCWRVPVTAPVTDPFRTPACRWCAGNRGIEYTVEPGTPVRAAATGRVTFAGRVAGVRYVVVEVEPGWRVTYGALASSRLGVGDPVVAGSIVGRSSARLHFGLRVDGQYRDPAPHLGRAVGVPRLVPLDGHPARPAPPARLVCP
jgi:murein DD-endopeptidase MepM/ murein hydrolase activator NlpD